MRIHYESIATAIRREVTKAEAEGRNIESIQLNEEEWLELLHMCHKDPNRTSMLSFQGVRIMRDTAVWDYVTPSKIDNVDL